MDFTKLGKTSALALILAMQSVPSIASTTFENHYQDQSVAGALQLIDSLKKSNFRGPGSVIDITEQTSENNRDFKIINSEASLSHPAVPTKIETVKTGPITFEEVYQIALEIENAKHPPLPKKEIKTKNDFFHAITEPANTVAKKDSNIHQENLDALLAEIKEEKLSKEGRLDAIREYAVGIEVDNQDKTKKGQVPTQEDIEKMKRAVLEIYNGKIGQSAKNAFIKAKKIYASLSQNNDIAEVVIDDKAELSQEDIDSIKRAASQLYNGALGKATRKAASNAKVSISNLFQRDNSQQQSNKVKKARKSSLIINKDDKRQEKLKSETVKVQPINEKTDGTKPLQAELTDKQIQDLKNAAAFAGEKYRDVKSYLSNIDVLGFILGKNKEAPTKIDQNSLTEAQRRQLIDLKDSIVQYYGPIVQDVKANLLSLAKALPYFSQKKKEESKKEIVEKVIDEVSTQETEEVKDKANIVKIKSKLRQKKFKTNSLEKYIRRNADTVACLSNQVQSLQLSVMKLIAEQQMMAFRSMPNYGHPMMPINGALPNYGYGQGYYNSISQLSNLGPVFMGGDVVNSLRQHAPNLYGRNLGGQQPVQNFGAGTTIINNYYGNGLNDYVQRGNESGLNFNGVNTYLNTLPDNRVIEFDRVRQLTGDALINGANLRNPALRQNTGPQGQNTFSGFQF